MCVTCLKLKIKHNKIIYNITPSLRADSYVFFNKKLVLKTKNMPLIKEILSTNQDDIENYFKKREKAKYVPKIELDIQGNRIHKTVKKYDEKKSRPSRKKKFK